MKNYKNLFLLLAVLIFSANVNAQSPATSGNNIISGSNSKAGKYSNNRGFKMYDKIYGKGNPLLIIHGNGGSVLDFTNQIPFFEKNRKVILADSKAQGKSIDNSDSLSYESMSDDLNALLDHWHFDSCYMIGWSDGVINELLLAIGHPDKVKKLAVTSANLAPNTSAVQPEIDVQAKSLGDSSHKLPLSPQVQAYCKLFHLLAYEPNIGTRQLQTIQCPVLVIGGDHGVIRLRLALVIAESIPRSCFCILPGSGHATPVVYAGICTKELSGFLKNSNWEIEGLNRRN